MHHVTFYSACIWLLYSIVFSGTVYAASFNCDNANNKITHAICNNSDLSSLDEEMSMLYFSIKNDPALSADDLKSRQKVFLSQRDACAKSKNLEGCLFDRYLEIINEYQKFPRSVNTDEFEFDIHIKKTYYRLDITHPEWSYLTEIYMRTKGCSEGSWCESDGYLVVKDTVTELITQVIYLPHAFVFTDYKSANKANVAYNSKIYPNSVISIFNKDKDDNISLVVPCTPHSNPIEPIKTYFFQYENDKLHYVMNKSDCARADH